MKQTRAFKLTIAYMPEYLDWRIGAGIEHASAAVGSWCGRHRVLIVVGGAGGYQPLTETPEAWAQTIISLHAAMTQGQLAPGPTTFSRTNHQQGKPVRTCDAEMTARRTNRYTNGDMLDALRQAARLRSGPLTVAAYDEYQRAHGGPSGIWLVRRFGTWRAACQAVGAQCNATRSWSRRWSDTDLIEWVATYLASPDAKGTYNDYLHWARETPDAPSGPTVRAVFPRWGELKNVAANMVAIRAARTA